MTPDYDLSDLANSQADLWLYLHADAIRVRILLDQATRQASGDSRRRPASRARRKQSQRDLGLRLGSLGKRANWEALRCAVQPLSRRAWPGSYSSGVVTIPAIIQWVH